MTARPSITTEEARKTRTEVPVEAVEESARACLEWLPSDALERLASYLKPHVIRSRRLRERGRLVRELAVFYSDSPSARLIAQKMRSDMRRVITTRGADDAHRAGLRRLVALSRGRIPSRTILCNAMAGLDERD